MTDQGCQKRLSKYNGLVNRMTSEQVDDELRKRQLSTRLQKALVEFSEIKIIFLFLS